MKSILKTPVLLVTLSCSLMTFSGYAGTPEGTIKYRQSQMTAISGHLGAARRLLEGEFEAEGHLELHAHSLAGLMQDMGKMFPADTAIGKTDAKPAIWENWEDFENKSVTAEKAAQAFSAAVDSADQEAISKAFRKLGFSCRGCHEDYRE